MSGRCRDNDIEHERLEATGSRRYKSLGAEFRVDEMDGQWCGELPSASWQAWVCGRMEVCVGYTPGKHGCGKHDGVRQGHDTTQCNTATRTQTNVAMHPNHNASCEENTMLDSAHHIASQQTSSRPALQTRSQAPLWNESSCHNTTNVHSASTHNTPRTLDSSPRAEIFTT